MNKLLCAHCRKTFEAVRRDAVTCSPRCRKARDRRLLALTPPLPDVPLGSIDLLLVDAPLAWHGRSAKGEGRSPQQHYPTADIPALCRLGERWAPLIAKNAIGAFWVYGPRLDELLLRVIPAFGFRYTAEGFDKFDWIKTTNDGGRPRMVMGKHTRKGKETVWLAKRGNGLKIVDHGVREVILAPIGEPSEKPQEVHEGLERLYGEMRRAGLFARQERAGWLTWGNELDHARQLQLPLAAE
jgi:N6-adenosine-specific RNA methylase IME4